eukprot:6671185-Prymnesium_polylepis.1
MNPLSFSEASRPSVGREPALDAWSPSARSGSVSKLVVSSLAAAAWRQARCLHTSVCTVHCALHTHRKARQQ